MNEPEVSLSERLILALTENTKAQTALTEAIDRQAAAIDDLVNTIAQDDDADSEASTSYLSGAPR